jgi:hypothetical protein
LPYFHTGRSAMGRLFVSGVRWTIVDTKIPSANEQTRLLLHSPFRGVEYILCRAYVDFRAGSTNTELKSSDD